MENKQFSTTEEWEEVAKKDAPRLSLREAVVLGRRAINSDPAASRATMFLYFNEKGKMRGIFPFGSRYDKIAGENDAAILRTYRIERNKVDHDFESSAES